MKRNYFNYRKFRNRYLLTNDLGRYCFLTRDEYMGFLAGTLPPESAAYQELKEKYFLYDSGEWEFCEKAGKAFCSYRRNLFQGTALHIFVLTKQCNQQCVYCQASTKTGRNYNMTQDIAARAVDIALQSPAPVLSFEFQGGEPLLNFDTLKFIVEYTERHRGEKQIEFSVVSNLMLLDKEKMEYLAAHEIGVCTSLDGDEALHNKNRPLGSLNSYRILMDKLNLLKAAGCAFSAIQTTTRDTLADCKNLIGAYVDAGLSQIFIRPLTPLGYAGANWDKIGYTAKEFGIFYREALDEILGWNRRGVHIREGHARMFLRKILCHDAGNYMELRSPCGGAIGQMAYYYNGKIYTCDEARMLAEMGDNRFCLGNVFEADYNSLTGSPVCRVLADASCLESLNSCSSCVYQPFCGTCPVISLARYGTVYPQRTAEYRCEIYKEIQNVVFEKLYERDESVMEIFREWTEE